ncbi:MAG: hypothetical protein ACR2NP_15460 [Pirellulaceae bacterium]
MSENDLKRFDFSRIAIGVVGLAMLLTAIITLLRAGYDENAFLTGVCSKVGFVLLAICLAWPSLAKLTGRLPAIVNGSLLAIVVFIAIRPRLFPLILAGVVITLAVHFGLRFAANRLK